MKKRLIIEWYITFINLWWLIFPFHPSFSIHKQYVFSSPLTTLLLTACQILTYFGILPVIYSQKYRKFVTNIRRSIYCGITCIFVQSYMIAEAIMNFRVIFTLKLKNNPSDESLYIEYLLLLLDLALFVCLNVTTNFMIILKGDQQWKLLNTIFTDYTNFRIQNRANIYWYLNSFTYYIQLINYWNLNFLFCVLRDAFLLFSIPCSTDMEIYMKLFLRNTYDSNLSS